MSIHKEKIFQFLLSKKSEFLSINFNVETSIDSILIKDEKITIILNVTDFDTNFLNILNDKLENLLNEEYFNSELKWNFIFLSDKLSKNFLRNKNFTPKNQSIQKDFSQNISDQNYESSNYEKSNHFQHIDFLNKETENKKISNEIIFKKDDEFNVYDKKSDNFLNIFKIFKKNHDNPSNNNSIRGFDEDENFSQDNQNINDKIKIKREFEELDHENNDDVLIKRINIDHAINNEQSIDQTIIPKKNETNFSNNFDKNLKKDPIISDNQKLDHIVNNDISENFANKNSSLHNKFSEEKISVSTKSLNSYDQINSKLFPKKIILVAAGKGGVGKSTISSLLALQLKEAGNEVGILDADIYGPSIPTIFGAVDSKPEIISGKFEPLNIRGIKMNSIGFLTKSDGAIAWRGPMISKALNQLLYSTNWGNLDYLIIDMPPGTGDIHISIAKICKIDYSIIVSTPDKLSVADVSRAIDLYRVLNINILGIVENMSYFIDSNSDIKYPFGLSVLDDLAEEKNINLIAKIPMIFGMDIFESYKLPELNIPIYQI